MKLLKQLFCKHQYVYKYWYNTYPRPSSIYPEQALVFRCAKCGKYAGLLAGNLWREQTDYMLRDIENAPPHFRLELPFYTLSGDEGFAVYHRYLRKGIDLMQVHESEQHLWWDAKMKTARLQYQLEQKNKNGGS